MQTGQQHWLSSDRGPFRQGTPREALRRRETQASPAGGTREDRRLSAHEGAGEPRVPRRGRSVGAHTQVSPRHRPAGAGLHFQRDRLTERWPQHLPSGTIEAPREGRFALGRSKLHLLAWPGVVTHCLRERIRQRERLLVRQRAVHGEVHVAAAYVNVCCAGERHYSDPRPLRCTRSAASASRSE